MNKLKMVSALLILFFPLSLISNGQSKPLYQSNIDWEWGDLGAPSKARCLAYVINGSSGAKTLRGNASARQCVVNAIKAYRKEKLEEALNWLKAGQCHNDGARATIADAGQNAIQYASETYGIQVPE